MPHQTRFHRGVASPLLGSALAVLAATSALAQEQSPYYIGVSQTFSHDSNVYRQPSDEVSETISSTGVLVGFDQPLGRQRLFGDASAQVNRYRNVDALDNKSYAISAGLDWETIEFLSGRLRYSTRDSLADFGTLGGSTAASDQNTQQFIATARYGLSSKLSFDAGYEHRRLKYRNPVYEARNFEQDSANAGMRWGTPGLLTFGAAIRVTQGELQTVPVADELKRRDIDLTTTWTPTGFSTLNARISATKETHTLNTSADVSGVTGALTWDYRPTAKLGFTAALTRDTGTETTFISSTDTGSTPLPVDRSRISNSAQLEARYALTSKISFSGEARRRKGSLATGENDSMTGYGLGVTYDPTRSVTLGCNVLRESRDAGVTVYTATTSSCSAQFTLR
jgi:hypothetical protein